jgi:hypothetical protein
MFGRAIDRRQSVSTAGDQEQFCLKNYSLNYGGFMYLLFGPAMAGVIVIGFIQLRDQFKMSN